MTRDFWPADSWKLYFSANGIWRIDDAVVRIWPKLEAAGSGAAFCLPHSTWLGALNISIRSCRAVKVVREQKLRACLLSPFNKGYKTFVVLYVRSNSIS